jgi:hypothetical protein
MNLVQNFEFALIWIYTGNSKANRRPMGRIRRGPRPGPAWPWPAERRSGRGHGRGLTDAEEGGVAELMGEDGGDWRRRSAAGRRRRGFWTAVAHGFEPWQRRGARTRRSEEAGKALDRGVGAGTRGEVRTRDASWSWLLTRTHAWRMMPWRVAARWENGANRRAQGGEREADKWDPAADFIPN